jgi:hypothetical protein
MCFMYLHARLLLATMAFEIAELDSGAEYQTAFMRTYTAAVEMIRWVLDDENADSLLQNL